MVLVGTYTNIDGLFIGGVLGEVGIAAINFAWPIVALITSLGTGIGIGGSVILNSLRGKGDEKGAERVKFSLVILLALVGIVFSVLLYFLSKPLLLLMGTTSDAFEYALEYSKIVSLGAIFQILGAGLVALLRNEEKTIFSMICCIAGLVVHLVLDMLLVEKFTLAGVACSTVFSQLVIMIMCFFAIKFKGSFKECWKDMPSILKASTSPIGINFVPSLVLLFTNYFAGVYGGTVAVGAYGVMSYAVYTLDYIFQGVCDGVQPVVSYCHGALDKKNQFRALKVAGILIAVFSAVFILLTPLLIMVMPKLFSISPQGEALMKTGFYIYALSYLFKGIVKYVCSYYYAINKTTTSNLLICLDAIVLSPLTLFLLPKIGMGINGIWWSLPITQIIVAVVAVLILYLSVKKSKKEQPI
jgi:Na+-driven multidrug efflux pump